jgi:hypothetical protein
MFYVRRSRKMAILKSLSKWYSGTATFSLLVNPKTDYGLRRCCFAQQLWFRGYKQQAVVVCFTPLIFGELKSVELEDERVV